MAIRVHATVTIQPDALPEALDRAREMVRADPNVLHAEIGQCVDSKTGDVELDKYVVTTVFTDHHALHRYATGTKHNEVHDWVLPLVVGEQVSVHLVEQVK
jgi:hypothetical protein